VGLAKYFARKFAVGGTARFVAKAYFFALRNNVFDIENCSTKNGLEAEIDKIVQFSLAVRFRMNPNHVHANQIYNVFKQGTESGLGSVEIWDSQVPMFVIQAPKGAFHGSQEFDGRPMGEDAAALPWQGERSRPHRRG
jgi:hypothetical protein